MHLRLCLAVEVVMSVVVGIRGSYFASIYVDVVLSVVRC